MSKVQKRSAGQVALRLLLVLYGVLMLWLLFGQRMGTVSYDAAYWTKLAGNVNLKPLHTLKLYLAVLERNTDPGLLRHAVINLVGNVVMFIPLGLLPPAIYKAKCTFLKLMLCVSALILAVEAIQLFTLLGSCDIDDLILNLFGTAVGYSAWKLYRLLRR